MYWVNVILLALAAAVYPLLLGGVLLILSRPNPLPKLIGFLSGGLAISVGAGIGIFKGFESSRVISKPSHSGGPTVDTVEIVIGAVSLLIAWGLWSGHIRGNPLRRKKPARGQPNKPSLAGKVLSRGSVPMAVLAGMLLNLPGAWYLTALFEIARARPSTAKALAAIVVFNVIMFALLEIPIISYLVDPGRASERANKLSSWTHEHSHQIWIAVAAAVGVWLIIKGAVNLS
jgi:Sap-like sulfolipid-1-addressing protein